jgi:hypothetical protein
LTGDNYNKQRRQYIDNAIFPKNFPDSDALRKLDEKDPSQNAVFREHLQKSYGGCWRFNEIIGYIRLYFLGSQIRGEYYGVRKQRLVRTRTKKMEFQTWKLVPEIDIPFPTSNKEIFCTVNEYLDKCKKALPRRYIDTSMFEVIAPYINWRKLYEDSIMMDD